MKGNPVCRQMGRVAEVLDFGDQRMRVRRRMEGQAGKQRMGTETQARRRRERRTRKKEVKLRKAIIFSAPEIMSGLFFGCAALHAGSGENAPLLDRKNVMKRHNAGLGGGFVQNGENDCLECVREVFF